MTSFLKIKEFKNRKPIMNRHYRLLALLAKSSSMPRRKKINKMSVLAK
jgi:hypothetical protein